MILAESVLAGDRLALARLLTQVENDTLEGHEALIALFSHTGKAHLVGVTGATGSGKSSLVNQLVLHFCQKTKKRVAVIAVDPTSPFTGGAVLGDRIRMRDLAGDTNVFIRSMASRGSLGGLSCSTAAMAQVLDAAGYEVVFIETVGAGQAEVDIARLAHTTLVVASPGFGDDVQAIKAGILEIADILVINKADLPGVESAERALRGMLEVAHSLQRTSHHHGKMESVSTVSVGSQNGSWIPPIQRVVATQGSGIQELVKTISRHANHLRQNGEWEQRERARLQFEVELLVRETLENQFRANIPKSHYDEVLADVFARKKSPIEAVNELLNGRRK